MLTSQPDYKSIDNCDVNLCVHSVIKRNRTDNLVQLKSISRANFRGMKWFLMDLHVDSATPAKKCLVS